LTPISNGELACHSATGVRIPFECKQSGRIRVEERVPADFKSEADAIQVYTPSAVLSTYCRFPSVRPAFAIPD
jgi:hypothetical protein